MSRIVNLRPVYERARAVTDKAFYRAWASQHGYCMACGVPAAQAPHQPGCGGIGLTTHHIVKFGRSDEAANLLRLCQRDHDLAELRAVRVDGVLLPRLTLGVCLSIKVARDPSAYDPARLAVLYGGALPDLETIPAFLSADWHRWRGGR